MNFRNRLFLALLLALSVHVHALSSALSVPKRSVLDSQLFYQLLLGEINARSDERASAFALILDGARKTNDDDLYRRAVQIAMQARTGDSALLAAKAWKSAKPSSREANRVVLQILLGLNRVTESLTPLKRELALTPLAELRDTLWALAGFYEGAADKVLAAHIVQKAFGTVLRNAQVGATAWAAVGRLWLRAGNVPVALRAATKAMAFDQPHEHPALLALSMMATGVHGSEEIVRQHITEPARPEFQIAYVRVLLGVKRDEDASAALKTLISEHPDFADARLLLGALSLQNMQLAPAEAQFQLYLTLIQADTSPKTQASRGASQAFMALAQIAMLRKNFAQADVWLQRVVHPEDIMMAQIQRAHLMAEQNQVDDALALIHDVPARSLAEARLKRSANIQILREHKRYAQAREILELAIAQEPQNWDLIYELATVVEPMGDLVEMERLLRQLIAAKPQDPSAYNALGYALADRNMRLAEARDLIVKALELAPGDPFITDSLAWVTFRMGQSDEALRLLQIAFAKKPEAEVAAHLGEVLWSLNRQSEALTIWREGAALNPANDTLIQTLKRFGVSL
jgi:tetratricopeptide (TPR) repeat protein